MIKEKDAAVSAVVGVMLMLVVTIVIAAVVSAFAGGIAGDQHKTPQTTLAVTEVLKGFTSPVANGLMFENTGGDTFSLNDIEVQLQSQDTKLTLTPLDTLPSATCLPTDITTYFQKIGNTGPSDTTIAPGDKFMLYADNCDSNTWGGPQISWKPMGAAQGFAAYLNTKIGYKIIDKASSRVISSGEIFLK